jgi:hypothetical protein
MGIAEMSIQIRVLEETQLTLSSNKHQPDPHQPQPVAGSGKPIDLTLSLQKTG